MNAVAKASIPALLWRLWRDPAAWPATIDAFVILVAFSLPRSMTAIFAAAILVPGARMRGALAATRNTAKP